MTSWTLTTTIFCRRPVATAAGNEITRVDAVGSVVNAARSALMDARAAVVAGTGPVYTLAINSQQVFVVGTGGVRSGDLDLEDALDHLEAFERQHLFGNIE